MSSVTGRGGGSRPPVTCIEIMKNCPRLLSMFWFSFPPPNMSILQNLVQAGGSGGGNSSRKTGLFVGQSAVNTSVELPDDRQVIATELSSDFVIRKLPGHMSAGLNVMEGQLSS